jgi:hypothetical protein
VTITIDIDSEKIAGRLRDIADKLNGPEPWAFAGGEVRNLLKDHYREKNANEPNRLGGRRTNFWDQVGRSVSLPVPIQSGARITISDPRIKQKIQGGTISAKRVKFLTIPVHPEAHGRRASSLERALGIALFVLITGGGNAMLAGRHNGQLTMYYALKRSVNQAPTRGALPTDDQIGKAAETGFLDWLEFELEEPTND